MKLIGKVVTATRKPGAWFIRTIIDGELRDVFCHFTAIRSPHVFKQLFIGDLVEFDYDPQVTNEHGPVAQQVECIYPEEAGEISGI